MLRRMRIARARLARFASENRMRSSPAADSSRILEPRLDEQQIAVLRALPGHLSRREHAWPAYCRFRAYLGWTPQTGALERVETLPNALPEPPSARYPRPRCALLGGVAEGILAHRWFLAAPTSDAKRLLAQVTRPERIPRPLPRFPGMLSEPPGADPHAGWCGRGQGKPGLYPILCGGRAEPHKRRPVPTATAAVSSGTTHPGMEAG